MLEFYFHFCEYKERQTTFKLYNRLCMNSVLGLLSISYYHPHWINRVHTSNTYFKLHCTLDLNNEEKHNYTEIGEWNPSNVVSHGDFNGFCFYIYCIAKKMQYVIWTVWLLCWRKSYVIKSAYLLHIFYHIRIAINQIALINLFSL